MKNKIKLVIVALCLSLSLQAGAIQNIKIEQNSDLGLNDCIKIALNNSPVIKKYILNLDVAKSTVGVAKSAYFPSISLGAGYKQGKDLLSLLYPSKLLNYPKLPQLFHHVNPIH